MTLFLMAADMHAFEPSGGADAGLIDLPETLATARSKRVGVVSRRRRRGPTSRCV
jgi:hypothetical protein